ncbi:alpha/beta hydrolase [Bremerella sp. JC770]|uniref:alpha/beta hydrolase n=1 Tax=Bremerella sp. JC770 TaxID=3232137 RepID=UPI003459A41B
MLLSFPHPCVAQQDKSAERIQADGGQDPAPASSARQQRRGRRSESGRTGSYEAFPSVLDAEFVRTKLPEGVRYVSDIVYKSTEQVELKLDLLLPASDSKPMPVAIWIHGGAWMRGNKAQDLHRFDQLTARILGQGIAFISIEYRLSGQAQFPEPVIDCNDAIAFIHANRSKYQLDTSRMVLLGTSAGGHLVSLISLSSANSTTTFFSEGIKPEWKILGVVDFYGPTDLLQLQAKRSDIDPTSDNSPEARFLGGSPQAHPELARKASPVNYVSENAPPFLIFHGDQDVRVSIDQSKLLNDSLKKAGVTSRLEVVEGARHGDQKFDDAVYNDMVVKFIQSILK